MLESFFDYQHTHKEFFVNNGTKITYKKGQYLVSPHEESPWVYFLDDGYVNASFGFYNGSERLLGFFIPGMSFAKVGSFFQRDDGNLEYIAVTPVTVYRVKQTEFLAELQKDQTFNAEYLNWLLKVQILLIERIVFLSQPTMELKVLHWINFMRKYYGCKKSNEGCRIAVPLTHDIAGNFLHVTRESVGKVLRDLEKNDVIRIEKKHITIVDTKKFGAMLA